jgi:hypothetical protein
VGQSDKLRHQMKAISTYCTATVLRSKVNVVFVSNSICGTSITLSMRGLSSCLGGLRRNQSSQTKWPALVVLVIDGSLDLYGRVCSSANAWKVQTTLSLWNVSAFPESGPRGTKQPVESRDRKMGRSAILYEWRMMDATTS